MQDEEELTLTRIVGELGDIKRRLDALEARSTAARAIADDRELDSKMGDPFVRKSPPRWTGTSFDGEPFSRCSPEFLDELAGFKEWCAAKNENDPDEKRRKYAGYDLKDAARARGWAARIRKGGYVPPAKAAPVDDYEAPVDPFGDDSLPF